MLSTWRWRERVRVLANEDGATVMLASQFSARQLPPLAQIAQSQKACSFDLAPTHQCTRQPSPVQSPAPFNRGYHAPAFVGQLNPPSAPTAKYHSLSAEAINNLAAAGECKSDSDE